MLNFFFKQNKQMNTFAIQLADDLFSAVPFELINEYMEHEYGKERSSNKIGKRIDGVLNDLAEKIQQYILSHNIGLYKKARLHLAFMGRLEELGYSANLAKKINEIILLKVAR